LRDIVRAISGKIQKKWRRLGGRNELVSHEAKRTGTSKTKAREDSKERLARRAGSSRPISRAKRGPIKKRMRNDDGDTRIHILRFHAPVPQGREELCKSRKVLF
jgi:hypothetical protein